MASRWFDSSAYGGEAWSPLTEGTRQQERLAGVATVLDVALATPSLKMRPQVVRWHNMAKMLIGMWSRVSLVDEEQISYGRDDASDDQILTGTDLDPHWYATTVIAQATVEATRAITAATTCGAPKRTLNQMSFYFTREVEELERLFGV